MLDHNGTCGIDEVGRGALAHVVLSAAVVFHGEPPVGLRDSKALTAARRATLADEIAEVAYIGYGEASVDEIDQINILQATLLSMTRAYQALPVSADRIRIDGNRIPAGLADHPDVEFVIRGDASHIVIAAASIVAKVARDRQMDGLHTEFPSYRWDKNRGYLSPAHKQALREFGPTVHHRRSFGPIREPTLL